MTAQNLQVELGVDAVVLGDHHGEAADHVFQSGQTLLDVVLTVHAQLGGTATGGDHNALISAGGNQSGSLDDGVSGTGAEAAGVGTGSVGQTGDLGSSLGEVTAAALVHITAGLLGAVDDVLNVGLLDAGVLDGIQQGQHGRGLGDQVLVHNVSGQVDVDIVSADDAAHQDVVVIQGLGVLIVDEMLNNRQLDTLGDAGQDGVVDDLVGFQSGLVGGHERLVQLDQVEHVAGLHQQQELFLGHHLAELTVTGVDIALLVIPGLSHSGQLIGSLVADIDLVGPISQSLVESTQMVGQFLQIFAFGVNDALGSLGGTVVQHHVGGMGQDVAGAFDNTFHFVHDLSNICETKIINLDNGGCHHCSPHRNLISLSGGDNEKKRLMQDSQKTARNGPHPVQRTIATEDEKEGGRPMPPPP